MCQRIECAQCKKPTYAGCGRHVEQVLGNVPKEQRCSCRDDENKHGSTKVAQASILHRLFGI